VESGCIRQERLVCWTKIPEIPEKSNFAPAI